MARRTRKASTKRGTKSPRKSYRKPRRKVPKLSKKQSAIFAHLMEGGSLDESE